MAISDSDARKIALAILEYKNKNINGDNDFYELHTTGLRFLRDGATKFGVIIKKLDEIIALLKKGK